MSKLKILTALTLALSLSGGTAVANELFIPQYRTDDVVGKTVPIAKAILKLKNDAAVPYSRDGTVQNFLFNCIDGRLKGLRTLSGVINGSITSCQLEEEFIFEADGGLLILEDAFSITWKG